MHRYQQPRPDEQACRSLAARIGRRHLEQRLGLEQEHALDTFGHGRWLHPENWLSLQRLARFFVRMSGIAAAGRPLARRHELSRVTQALGLGSRNAVTVLHLSDLHLDMAPDTCDSLIHSLQKLGSDDAPDLAVLTGDFRARTYGPMDQVVEAMQRLRPLLPERCYAVLGNHDCLAMVPAMEAMGIRFLLNEHVEVAPGLVLAGVDDPHFYRTDNLHRALEPLDQDVRVVLLSHSPEIYRQAAHAGVHLMLCGHTHGGQVCLPGGTALTYDCNCPRRYCRGAWQHGAMHGYTSRGCGTSILDIRFFCPPEIVLHRLV